MVGGVGHERLNPSESSRRDAALEDEPPEWRTLPAAGVQEVGPVAVRFAHTEFYMVWGQEFRVHLDSCDKRAGPSADCTHGNESKNSS